MAESTVRDAVRRGLTLANRPLARRRLAALLDSTPPPYRIELGAYRNRHQGWVPTDVGWRSRYWLDATEPWPVPPGSVGHVYGDNMIEHVALDQARLLFAHAHRAMAPRGRLRLVTPDAERFARMYLEDGELLRAHADRNRRHGYRVDHKVSLLRTVFAECGHHLGFVWDLEALAAELAAAGFVDVERCEVGESEDPVLRGLETRTEPSDRALFLVVEAIRP
jgi:predicted SAM-dependent methyltransferase